MGALHQNDPVVLYYDRAHAYKRHIWIFAFHALSCSTATLKDASDSKAKLLM